ncbi:MAG TPA: FdtA/QdtA family cupin domain-containing protein [Flavobacterium sp.]|jgi:dTDP-4-dehydrorhamnose 3,5-epimerase-like enzyme
MEATAKQQIVTTSIDDLKLINIPKIYDVRGNLSVVEKDTIPFEMKRIYYLYDVPAGSERGGHAHIHQAAFLIALSGSFEVIVNDGKEKRSIMLSKPYEGLLIPHGIWRELQNFSSGSVCLVIASDIFDEGDYIRDFSHFKSFKIS